MRRVTAPPFAVWGIAAAAFLAGLVAAGLMGPQFVRPAAAAAGSALGTPLDKLLAEDEIRQKIALYGLYADGDGVGGEPRNLRVMADTLMTSDVVSEIHLAAGGPPKIFTGRDVIAQSPREVDPEKAQRIVGRHYMVSTVFDDVSPNIAHTRTTAVYFDSLKNSVGPACNKAGGTECGGAPVKTIMWVYHMTWKKTPDGWQISRNVLRDDN